MRELETIPKEIQALELRVLNLVLQNGMKGHDKPITYEEINREQPRLVVAEDGNLILKTSNLPDVNVPPGCFLLIMNHPANGEVMLTLAGDNFRSEDVSQENRKHDTTGLTNL